MMNNIKQDNIAVLGAGLIGMRHAKELMAHPTIRLLALIDPDETKRDMAHEFGCAYHPSLDELDGDTCDGIIIATPNADHLPSALKAAEMGLPALVEKPIAGNLEDAQRLADAFSNMSLPLLVGHHRRYHPFVKRAKQIIDDHELGQPVIVSAMWAVYKPDDYFKRGAWRTAQDGGPLLINFIHEADLLLHLFGPIDTCEAMKSHAYRGQSTEDSVVMNLRFQSGVLASFALSDCALSPWSFEGASGENPNIARTNIAPWNIACTKGAFNFPNLEIWTHGGNGPGDWSKPLQTHREPAANKNPLREQLSHFSDLISGRADTPVCSGQDGINALKLVQTILTAANKGE